ncbi:MAG: exosortase-associated protein EpsI, V-type [Pontixanthobacter sp.]
MAHEKSGMLLTRRHAVMGGLLACASGVAYARRPQIAYPVIESEKFDKWVPKRFGVWREQSQSGVVLPPPDTLRDRLYDNLVTRVYSAPGEPSVMLLIAYNNAQNGVLQIHRPETCYPVGGFALTETRGLPLPLGTQSVPANVFTASGPDRTEQVVYFTRLGDAYPRSWVEQRLAVVDANLRGDIPDGIMMRVSVLGDNQQRAVDVLSQFTAAFYAASSTRLQKLLVA